MTESYKNYRTQISEHRLYDFIALANEVRNKEVFIPLLFPIIFFVSNDSGIIKVKINQAARSVSCEKKNNVNFKENIRN